MSHPTPLGALARGILAGASGSAAQDLFFAATKSIAPDAPEGAFTPPEPEQAHESATETVARRAVTQLARRELPIAKERAGRVVHYAFGAAWGALYGLCAGTFPRLATPLGAAAFGGLVWVASDDVLLPALRLSAWPTAYPARTHAYAIAAHVVYGLAALAVFGATAPRAEREARGRVRAARRASDERAARDTPRAATTALEVFAPRAPIAYPA